jgi:hypothetical protein
MMSLVVVAAQCLLAAVFAVSAVAKVRHGEAFRRFVAALRLPVRRAAVGVVSAELCAAVLLSVPVSAPAGFALALALLILFSAALARGLRLGVRTSCGCFGESAGSSGRAELVRNAALAAVAAAGLAGSVVAAPAAFSGESVAVGGLGLAAAIVIVRLDDLRKGLR